MRKKDNVLFFAIMCFIASGYATETPPTMPYDQGHAISQNQFPSGYNHQARINVDGWNVFISGSFIYWQAMEGGLELGVFYKDPGEPGQDNFISNILINFQYQPGFKVALGTCLGHDNWILSCEYTWLHFSDTKLVILSDVGDSYYISTSWTREAEHFYYSQATWKLRYDMIDLEMSRPFYVGTDLVMKPFGALRGGLIKQYYNICFAVEAPSSGNSWITNLEEKTWMLGPRAGIDCDWIFFNYFRLIGNAAMALFYQHFETIGYNCEFDSDHSVVDPFWNVDTSEWQITPNLEAALGLGWGSYFGANNRWHFDLSALYEVNYFLNQNKMRQVASTNLLTGAYAPIVPAQDLMMHGLTITARFDF